MTNPIKNSILSTLEGAGDLSTVLSRLSFVDIRFTDPHGGFHSKQILSSVFEKMMQEGSIFLDGSSIPGWASISNSDLRLEPVLESFRINPFSEYPSGSIIAQAFDPSTDALFLNDPRAIAIRSIEYLTETGIGDSVNIGPEPEFFIFDSVSQETSQMKSSYSIESEHSKISGNGNFYFVGRHADPDHELRSEILLTLDAMGIDVDSMHTEVGHGQHEIQLKHQGLVDMADSVMFFKDTIKNCAVQMGKTATFMPKPLYQANGSGMHVNLSIQKDGKNVFAGSDLELSPTARHFIGGIFKNANALCAFTNPSINSYKRLVPGYEAPTALVYGKNNRSAAIRIPPATSEASLRLEYRVPDAASIPYLCFSSMLMAGLDGIKNKVDPGEEIDYNLYHVDHSHPFTPDSLDASLNALEADHSFLAPAFSESFIEQYIKHKRDVDLLLDKQVPSPIDFKLYYDC